MIKTNGIVSFHEPSKLTHKTCFIEKEQGLEIEGRGMFVSTSSGWTKRSSGSSIACPTDDAIHLHGCIGTRIAKIGIVGSGRHVGIKMTYARGFGMGKTTIDRVGFFDHGVGVQCGDNENDHNCDTVSYLGCVFHSCKVGLLTLNNQSVEHYFQQPEFVNCDTCIYMSRGGNLLVEAPRTTPNKAGTTFLKIGYAGSNVGVYTVNSIKIDGTNRVCLLDTTPEVSVKHAVVTFNDAHQPKDQHGEDPVFIVADRVQLRINGGKFASAQNLIRLDSPDSRVHVRGATLYGVRGADILTPDSHPQARWKLEDCSDYLGRTINAQSENWS